MVELLNLQQRCLDLMQLYTECSQECTLKHYCVQTGCSTGDCRKCLYHIHYGHPAFSYSCNKITYYYTLRFFNRFASEINYMLSHFQYNALSDLNVVSLGCGPGSEVYGIIKTLLQKQSGTIIHYEGHDLLKCWESVQRISKECLKEYPHEVQFFTTDLFMDFHGFKDGITHILILNYIFSDAAISLPNDQKKRLVDNVANFVIDNKVKYIFFNDNCFYGEMFKLDSGTQLMKLLIQILEQKKKRMSVFFYCFSGDEHLGNEKWLCHKDNRLIFKTLENNPYMQNLTCCKSKQIFVHIQ